MAAFISGNNFLDLQNDQPYLRNVLGATLMAWTNVDILSTDHIVAAFGVGSPGALGASRAQLRVASTTLNSLGTIFAEARAGDSEAASTAQAPNDIIEIDRWFHIAAVIDYSAAGGFQLYLNGQLQSNASETVNFAQTGTDDTDAQRSKIGTDPTNGLSITWRGILEDLRLYSRALSAAEIQSIYSRFNNGPINLRDLQGHWPMTEGFGAPVTGDGQIIVRLPNVSRPDFPPAEANTVESNLVYAYGVTKRRKYLFG